MSKQNTASLFKKALGAQLTERDWNPNYPENLLSGLIYWLYSATDSNRWRFQWNSNFNFSGTVIFQLWVLSLEPFAISSFRHFAIGFFETRPLNKRGYSHTSLQRDANRVRSIPRDATLQPKEQKSAKADRTRFVTFFNPALPKLSSVFNKYSTRPQSTANYEKAFPNPPVIAYRRNASLRDLLVHPTLSHEKVFYQQPEGIKKCNHARCFSCFFFLQEVQKNYKEYSFNRKPPLPTVPPPEELVSMFFKWAEPSDTYKGFACLACISGLTEPLTRLLRNNEIRVVNKPFKTLQQEFQTTFTNVMFTKSHAKTVLRTT